MSSIGKMNEPANHKSLTFLRFGKKCESASHTLYAFAHAGGTASTYAFWARLLAPEIEVIGIEQPGHGTRIMEDPLMSVKEMAGEVIRELQKVVTGSERRPFAFYGHSLGAIVAFETARMLMADAGVAPSQLFVGAARAPHLPRIAPAISHLDEADFLDAVQQRYGGIPAAVLEEPELLEMILPGMHADFVAYEDYRYHAGPRLPCSILAFLGARDPIVREEAVANWVDHTSGSFQMHVVPGDHFFLTESRQQVLDTLTQALLSEKPATGPRQ